MSNNGQKIWKKAKGLIPGGNMILSKRSEMFLPDKWPTYYSKAKGCYIWSLDNEKFVDMSLMGVGTNILGYSNDEVDKAVIENITKGNMSTLNCKEEVELAEKLIEICSPWGDMVRFARSGGEANAIAVRIARAATGKDNVAICGYHGWHDWYLSANLQSKDELNNHLLSGLDIDGVPKNLTNTVFPFEYNNIKQLEEIINTKDIGTVKMEVVRNIQPEEGFLEKVRELTKKKDIVLIFDECTSGFRETFGGISKKYSINPDMSMFGKALGNGYAITAVVGKEEIMQNAQSSFISSTFWSERAGPTAALKTLDIMNKTESWKTITNKGKYIKKCIIELGIKNSIELDVFGIDPLPSFKIKSKYSNEYKTLISQELLKKKILATNSVYVSVAHTDDLINKYLDELDIVFKKIKDCENGMDIYQLLEGSVCQVGFKRIN